MKTDVDQYSILVPVSYRIAGTVSTSTGTDTCPALLYEPHRKVHRNTVAGAEKGNCNVDETSVEIQKNIRRVAQFYFFIDNLDILQTS